MFPYAISSIRTLLPKAFIFENVKGLLRDSFRQYFNCILLQLKFPGVTYSGGNWREHQTFPDDYPIYGSWTEAMHQLGNAVPVQLAYIVAKKLLQAIN